MLKTTLVVLICVLPAQQVRAQLTPVSPTPEEELAHALKHFALSRLVDVAAPTKDLRRQLDQQFLPLVKARLHAVLLSRSLTQDSRNALNSLSRIKHADDFADVLSESTTKNSRQLRSLQTPANRDLFTPLSSGTVTLLDIRQDLQQVVTNRLPALSVPPPAPSDGLTPITACTPPGSAQFYPQLITDINNSIASIGRLASSVGRIEIKIGDGTPTLDGTGFVIDQDKGLIATACHVANDIADFDSLSNKWTLPSAKLTNATILVDFGTTDAHDPQQEFQVLSVVFVPTINGCDGAILKVQTTGRSFPKALPLASTDLPMPLTSAIDAISIGYPSRNLYGNTPETTSYFSCIRAAAPLAAKFTFGGEITEEEAEAGYHILAHIVPTVTGQSGSPVIQISPSGFMQVVGIHICCTSGTATVTNVPQCALRDEPFMQEAVSMVDLINLYKTQVAAGNSALQIATEASFGQRSRLYRPTILDDLWSHRGLGVIW